MKKYMNLTNLLLAIIVIKCLLVFYFVFILGYDRGFKAGYNQAGADIECDGGSHIFSPWEEK